MAGRRDSEPINGWTVHTLKTYTERLLEERDQRYEDRFEAQADSIKLALQATDKAMELARLSMEKRLDQMNEFRQALQDQTRSYTTRAEFVSALKAQTDALGVHCATEDAKEEAQTERREAALARLKEKMENINKALLGLMGGVAVALILTIVDILVRQFAE